MPWVKLDDAIGESRKTDALLRRNKAGIGLVAFGLHVLALAYSSRNLSDGYVDEEWVEYRLQDAGIAKARRGAVVDALVQAGQWDEAVGGWTIHDFLEWNPSREQVEAARGVDRFRKELTRDAALIKAIRARDGSTCRYCAVEVNWKDRKSSIGGTYDHVVPVSKGGDNSYENVVVACRACNSRKGAKSTKEAGMPLLNLAGSSPGADISSPDLAAISDSHPVPHPHPKDNHQTGVATPTELGGVVVEMPDFGGVA